jgi:hypothetical protein
MFQGQWMKLSKNKATVDISIQLRLALEIINRIIKNQVINQITITPTLSQPHHIFKKSDRQKYIRK